MADDARSPRVYVRPFLPAVHAFGRATRAIVDQIRSRGVSNVQGGFDPSKISRPGYKFGLLVRSLLGPNKQRARKPSMI